MQALDHKALEKTVSALPAHAPTPAHAMRAAPPIASTDPFCVCTGERRGETMEEHLQKVSCLLCVHVPVCCGFVWERGGGSSSTLVDR